jgi:hypothetical protein
MLAPLIDTIEAVLPRNAAELSNAAGLTVAVTRVWPTPQLNPVLVSSFGDRADLAAALVASCYIPGYISSAPYVFRSLYCYILLRASVCGEFS